MRNIDIFDANYWDYLSYVGNFVIPVHDFESRSRHGDVRTIGEPEPRTAKFTRSVTEIPTSDIVTYEMYDPLYMMSAFNPYGVC